jgi:hypothetical protein
MHTYEVLPKIRMMCNTLEAAYILIIILFVQKDLKTTKTNGVPIQKQNYSQ